MSNISAPVKINHPAPDWSALVSRGGREESLSSSDLIGQSYILYFYPKDQTPGCTTQACDFRDHLGQLTELGYRVIGASPDSIKSHLRFQKKQNFSFDLIADEDHSIAERFGVWREKKNYGRTYMGIVRSTFVIDEQGEITHMMENVRAKGHVARVIQELSKED